MVLDPLGLQLQVAVSHLTWVLGIFPSPLQEQYAVCILNHSEKPKGNSKDTKTPRSSIPDTMGRVGAVELEFEA